MIVAGQQVIVAGLYLANQISSSPELMMVIGCFASLVVGFAIGFVINKNLVRFK